MKISKDDWVIPEFDITTGRVFSDAELQTVVGWLRARFGSDMRIERLEPDKIRIHGLTISNAIALALEVDRRTRNA